MQEVFFLGAGKPFNGIKHSALRKLNKTSSVIDWSLDAFSYLKPKFNFICGYQSEAIIKAHPNLNFIKNHDWGNTKAGWSLLNSISNSNNSILVCYSDIVFRESAVRKINRSSGDIIVGIDSQWLRRYSGRSEYELKNCEKVCYSKNNINLLGSNIELDKANAEFIGLVHFSKKAVKELLILKNELDTENLNIKQLNLSDLIELLRLKGFGINYVDLKADWAQLNEEQDLAKFILGTKAQTLRNLKKILKHSRVEDQFCFDVKSWKENSKAIISNIQKEFCNVHLIIRSSAISEDGFFESKAGMFESVLNVPGDNSGEINKAIKKVIGSYPDNNSYNQVLVQPMLKNVLVSGVAFTRTLQGGAPYYSINYDDLTGSTESITSGTSINDKKIIISRHPSKKLKNIPKNLSNLIPAIKEIETLLNYDSLDIEFAITKRYGIHILQVRPMTIQSSMSSENDNLYYDLLGKCEMLYDENSQPSPFILGNKQLYGVMPDWNPAEIIGTKPNILSVSLYNDLILNDIWAKQRAEYGYKDVRPKSLLVNFAGHPYIDIRASFNSFVPKDLKDNIAKKLVNFSLNWLEEHPELHDKVEFDVIPTCYDLNFDKWEKRLIANGGLSKNEVLQIKLGLLKITNDAIKRNDIDFKAIEILENRLQKIKKAKMPPLQKALLLLEDAKLYGTLPFAHLARSAFVAISLIRSGVSTNLLTKNESDDFLNSIETVSHEFTKDCINCSQSKISWKNFVNKYGHLRPGTYDINSLSYISNPELYLKPAVIQANKNKLTKVNPWIKFNKKFYDALLDSGINATPDQINKFFKTAIEGREYSKFAFTKNLSLALDEIVLWAKSHGIEKDIIANISIEDLKMLSKGLIPICSFKEWLSNRANENIRFKDIIKFIELPPLISSKNDFYQFLYPDCQPNYIGNNKISAQIINLENVHAPKESVAGKIVLIPQADPGYDWLFGRNISGLITMYGGANSHMAIRSAEFGLPAAIGVGETLYRKLSNSSKLELNPEERIIRCLT